MQVAHGRTDGGVPEAALDDVQFDPRLEKPGGVAMAQRVDPAGLGDPSLLLGLIVNVGHLRTDTCGCEPGCVS